jgi:P27 family predicted phage terminase small subunit
MSLGNRGGGRPRKSAAAKALAGTARPDRAIKPLAAGDPLAVLTPPKALSREAKAEWRELAPQVHRLGLLTQTTAQSFKLLCQVLGTVRQMEAVLADGMTVVNDKGVRRSRPEVHILQNARAQARALLESWGLSPRSRQNVDVTPRGQIPPLTGFTPTLVKDGEPQTQTLRQFLLEGDAMHAENLKKYDAFHNKEKSKK